METFLKQVAADLYNRTQGHLSRTAVVFPNKRAGLFFNEYLSQQSDTPIWAPTYLSISELFKELSSWEIGDPIKLICELYKVFCTHTNRTETLDNFYFWGELLLSDFDDADKNMADTDALFRNLQDLRTLMNDYSFMDKEQEAAIQQFFQNFSIEHRTELKDRFISLWDVLGEVYRDYRNALKAQHIAYEGMLYREAVENLNIESLPYDTYVFVGFNALNKVEYTLFKRLQDARKALFYWDYDPFYMDSKKLHEAGVFIQKNLREFPSALPEDAFKKMKNLNSPKEIRYIRTPTENAQVRYLPQWIRQNLTETETETAIVLCNESMLQPALHSLPSNVEHINITMGFPLSQTPVHSFLTTLLELQLQGYQSKNGRFLYQQVMAVLKHPYTRRLTQASKSLEMELTQKNRFYPLPSELQRDELLAHLFHPVESNPELIKYLTKALENVADIYRKENTEEKKELFNQLYRESIFRAYTTLNRFSTLIEEGSLNVQKETLRKLLIKVLSNTSIPFHGEPVIGMQIMGVLETRNLDFRNLILLSVNEGKLPKTGGDSSFIPYNLRKAFGMTTIDHKMSVYAYNFYRLMQRAEKVTLMYNNSSDGLNRGEWSRFMLQFLIESNHPIVQQSLVSGQSPQGSTTIRIPKTQQVMERMHQVFDLAYNPQAKLSPSALNGYLDCPLQFYYKYIAGLKVPDEVSPEIDSATFGSIFHKTAENIYKDLTQHGNYITQEALKNLEKDTIRLESYVDDAFKKLFFHIPNNEKPEYNGIQLINSAVIVRYIKQLLQHDIRYAPFNYVESEKSVTEKVCIHTPSGDFYSYLGGYIDRLDCKEDTFRIVDYKTGGKPDMPANVESLFIPDKKRLNYVFQTFLYASIMSRQQKLKVAPALLYIHRAASENYSPVICLKEGRNKAEPVTDFSIYETEFRERLQKLLEEIFNPDVDFTQTEVEEKCAYCDFKALCKK